jgi:hypothetical protein
MSVKISGYLMVISVFQEKISDDVVCALTEIGVKDVCSVTAVNETRRLPYLISIFAGLKGILGKTSSLSKIYLAVVENEKAPEEFLSSLKLADVDFIGDDFGQIILLPLQGIFKNVSEKKK